MAAPSLCMCANRVRYKSARSVKNYRKCRLLERFFQHYVLNLLKQLVWYALCYVDRDVNAFTFGGNTNRLLPMGGQQKSRG